jgi:SNF2 family DNA or RNA helicase
VLHGKDRHDVADSMAEHDIVIAPYSLLQRDKERWLEAQWHLVVLDEAQNIKNASTHAAQVVGQLQHAAPAVPVGHARWKTTWAKSGACSTF